MSRTTLVRGVAVLILAGLAVAAFLVFRSGESGRERADPLPTGDLPVSAEANDLASRVREGQELAYHAVYRVKAPNAKNESVEIETWRQEGLVRWDETIRAEGRVVRTSSFRLADRSVTCTRADDEAWQCQPLPAASPAPDPVIGRVVEELAGKDVDTKDERIAGRRARCYTISEGSQRADVCLTSDGIPVAYRIESASLELVDLDEGPEAVPDDVFEPPAG